MSRVERTENPSERRGSEQLRQAQRGRRGAVAQGDSNADSNPGRTPTKAEGEVADVEEALRHQNE
jgi:hypothetical protein